MFKRFYRNRYGYSRWDGTQNIEGLDADDILNALADDYMDWLEHGVANVDWWDLHNGPSTGNNNSSSLYGSAQYGDYGLLSVGTSPEPAANTPFPPYYGLQMLSKIDKPGNQMIGASATQWLIATYAVKQSTGDIVVLLINKDPNNTYTAKLSWSGFTPGPNPTAYFYGENSTSVTTIRESGLPPDYVQYLPP